MLLLNRTIGFSRSRVASNWRQRCIYFLFKLRSLHTPLVKGLTPQRARSEIHAIAKELRRCGKTKALSKGKCIHDHLVATGLHNNLFLSNHLIEMYGKCGKLEFARMVFDDMEKRDSFSWNLMILGYTQHGHLKEALHLFTEMAEKTVVTWTAMIMGYSKHGQINEALELFKQMPERDVVSWNAMIGAYVKQGRLQEALDLFEQMPHRDACSWNAMICGYAQQGQLQEAFELFKRMPTKDLISWNSIISAFVQHGQLDQALQLFEKMPQRDVVSWTTMLSGYAQQGHFEKACEFFRNMPQRNVVSWNAMLGAYVQQGCTDEAIKLFYEMPQRSLVSWNAIISACASQGKPKEAFTIYNQMLQQGILPDRVTFVSILDACAQNADLAAGKQIHNLVMRLGLDGDQYVQSAVVVMYAKCGTLDIARLVFDSIPQKDVVLWTTMITLHAQHGHGKQAIQIFQHMHKEQMKPDKIAFGIFLSACSHAGLRNEGCHWFVSMCLDYSITLTLEHCTCIIDLYGRAGRSEEAEDLISHIPFEPDMVSWTALFGSCAYRDIQCTFGLHLEENALTNSSQCKRR